MNYQKLTQWISGPFSVFIGGLATKLVVPHGALLSSLGLSVKGTAQGITAGAVFVASTAVTYAGHHKYLTNVAKWWESSGLTLPAVSESGPAPEATVTTVAPVNGPGVSTADTLRDQLSAHGIKPVA